MSSNLNRDLAEAYNQIRINEEQKYEKELNEYVDYIFNDMINEGYNITEEEVRQFCLDEGIPGWGTIKTFVSGAEQGMKATARRQAAAERLRQRLANRQAAANAQRTANVQKAGETTGKVLKTLTPGKKAIVGGLAAGTTEFAASGQATGDGRSVAAGIPASIVGGVGNVLQQGGRPLSAVGYPGIEKTGEWLKGVGSWMAGGDNIKNKERNPYNLQKQSIDLFDLVKGHLLDEGYASTEEQAVVIMANMGEKWKQEILEKVSEN